MRPNKDNIRIEIIYFLSALIFIIVNLLGFSKGISQTINNIFTPLISVGSEIGSGLKNASDAVVSIKTIRNERNSLLIENANLKAQVAQSKDLEDELNILRSKLDYDDSLFDTIPTTILSWGYGNIDGSLILNRGSLDGVKVGNSVTIGNIFNGVIRETSDTTSTVLLPTNGSSTYEIIIIPYRENMALQDRASIEEIIDKERVQIWNAISIGSNGTIILENIPKNSSVKVGDHVLISDKDIPEHYYLGDISKVIVDPTDVQIRAIVAQPLELKKVTKVLINVIDE